MPSTVADILDAPGASSAGVVRWGESVARPDLPHGPAAGVYVVALTDAVDAPV